MIKIQSWLKLLLLLHLPAKNQRVEGRKPRNCPTNNNNNNNNNKGCSDHVDCFDTLEDLITFLMCKAHDSHTELYVPPSNAMLTAWKDVVSSMLLLGSGGGGSSSSSNYNNNCSMSLLPPILSQDYHYKLGRFHEKDGREYCVLASFQLLFDDDDDDDNDGRYLKSPYGAVVINLGSSASSSVKPLSIDIPHSVHDDETWRQGIVIFKGTNAKIYTLSLAHRHASSKVGSCNFYHNNNNKQIFRIADAAHNIQHTFQATALAIKEYYDGRRREEDYYTAIQFHGMGYSTCPDDDIVLSHGVLLPSSSSSSSSSSTTTKRGGGGGGEKLLLIRDAIRNELRLRRLHGDDTTSIQRINIVGHDTDCPLVGTTNVQGRLYNGINRDDICSFPSSSSSDATIPSLNATGHFIHVEQKHFVRSNPEYDQIWIHALNTMMTTMMMIVNSNKGENDNGENNNNYSPHPSSSFKILDDFHPQEL